MRSILIVLFCCALCAFDERAIAADLLVSSRLGNAVLRYDGAGQPLGRFDGASTLFTPNGVLVRGEHVYVSSRDGNAILRYFLADGAFDRVFASGPEMVGPSGIVFGPDGDLFVANSLADNLARYDGDSGALVNMTSTAGTLSAPVGIAFGRDGDIYATGAINNAFARYDGETLAFDVLLAQGGLLGNPADIRLSPRDGNLYIASATQNRIVRFNMTNSTLTTFLFNAQLAAPVGIAFDGDGAMFVASFNGDKVVRVSTAGQFLGNYVAPGAGGLDGPQFLTFIPEPGSSLVVLFLSAELFRRRRVGMKQ